MIKKKREQPINLQNLQDKASTDKVPQPVDFYNRHIRKEGMPVLTEREYTDKLKERDIPFGKHILAQYPLTPEESFKTKEDGNKTNTDNKSES